MSQCCIRGFAKKNKFQKSEITLWKWVGVTLKFFFEKSSQNSPKPVLIFCSIPCVFCLHTLLQVVGYYDLSVLSMSVMGFQKEKVCVGGWGSSIQVFFGIFGIF